MQFAATPYIDPEPSALVRNFSWEVEARQRTDTDSQEFGRLRTDFIAEQQRRDNDLKREKRRIDSYFEANRSNDSINFDKAKAALIRAMKAFQDLVPGHDGSYELPRSWNEVWTALTETQTGWEAKTKSGSTERAKGWFRRMCNGMNNHSAALKMLPSESEYVSLVAGSVSMVIKAAANHISITEAFMQGIIEINDAVKLENLSHVYDSSILQQLTMRLYTHIFLYLIKFMTWFNDNSRTRFLKSFNESTNRLFKEELAQVKKTSDIISRQIQLHTSADTHITRMVLEGLTHDLRYLLNFSEEGEKQSRLREASNVEQFQAVLQCHLQKTKQEIQESMVGFMRQYHDMFRSELSGSGVSAILQQQAARDTQARLQSRVGVGYGMRNCLVAEQALPSSSRSIEEISPSSSQGQDVDLRLTSSHLEDYFSWDHVQPLTQASLPLTGETALLSRLDDFTTTLEPQTLYFHRQYNTTGTLRHAVSAYISLARTAGIPVISYFCDLSHDTPPNRTAESVELCALISALIRQLVNLLSPDAAASASTLDGVPSSALDGTLRSWPEALLVFERLLRAIELPLLLFVIDGLDILEDPFEQSTTEQILELVRLFSQFTKPSSSSEEDGPIVKVLFTTCSLSETLCEVLDEDEIVASSSSVPKSRRGIRLLRGRPSAVFVDDD